MIDLLINLVLYLVIAGVVWFIARAILGMIPLPEPFGQIINLVMILILVLVLIYALSPLLHSLPRLR